MNANYWMAFLLALGLVTSCGDTDEPAPQEAEETEETDELPETKDEAATLTNEGKGDFTLDICKARGWYGDGECDWWCPRRDEDCDADPIFTDLSGTPAQYPFVLAHGFMGSPTNFWAFKGVQEALEADGHEVYVAAVAPFNSPAFRAGQLAEDVDRALAASGAEKVHLIAHSMGGLDSRYMISTLEYGDRVASLTTVSTPHHGTRIADVGLGLLPGIADKAIDALLVMIGETFSDEAEEASFRASLEGIAESNIGAFNEANQDDERVLYQSWAGASSVTGLRNRDTDSACEDRSLIHDGTYDRMHALLWAAVPIVAGVRVDPNDGMALVESMKWGEFQGCIPADHIDQVGPIGGEAGDRNTGFNHVDFYRHIAYDLAAKGL